MINSGEKSGIRTILIFLLTDKKNISAYPSIDSCLGHQAEEEEISLLLSYTA
jgi:hypothetical protein